MKLHFASGWSVLAVVAALISGTAQAVDAAQAVTDGMTRASAVAWPVSGQEASASGVFLNSSGDVLTARHAVIDCVSLYVVKDARVVEATILALDPTLDLAVLRTSFHPALSATLAQSAPGNGSGVFTESYVGLQRMADRSSVLSNALTVPGDGALYLLSGALPGASGSAVLGSGGLMLGMVVERVARDRVVAELRVGRAPIPDASRGEIRIRAIAAAQIEQVLRAAAIPSVRSDLAQLGPRQSPAARAATLAVGIHCR